MSAEERAAVLIEALPYIQRFAGQVVVVKYGGNALAGAGPVRWWNWLLMSVGIAILWVTRELIEWHHVPVAVVDWPITRWIGSLALVAFAVAGLAMTPARRK